MNIRTVTVTGADNSTLYSEMLRISQMYPFVEWGILFSLKRQGECRYPSINWIKGLIEFIDANPSVKFNLSAHFCGEYTKEMISEASANKIYSNVMSELKTFGDYFDRVQLNFNASKNTIPELFYELFYDVIGEKNNNRSSENAFILQSNEPNKIVCDRIIEMGLSNINFLYDSSGGRGVVNDNWLPPTKNHFTGYAGGLTPENISEQLIKIESVAGDTEIWLDAESGLRSTREVDGYNYLDMHKVQVFLNKIAAKRNENL